MPCGGSERIEHVRGGCRAERQELRRLALGRVGKLSACHRVSLGTGKSRVVGNTCDIRIRGEVEERLPVGGRAVELPGSRLVRAIPRVFQQEGAAPTLAGIDACAWRCGEAQRFACQCGMEDEESAAGVHQCQAAVLRGIDGELDPRARPGGRLGHRVHAVDFRAVLPARHGGGRNSGLLDGERRCAEGPVPDPLRQALGQRGAGGERDADGQRELRGARHEQGPPPGV